MEQSPHRDHHNLRPPVCKPFDVAAGHIFHDAGKAAAEPVSLAHRWIDDRTLWRPPVQIRRSGEMAVLVVPVIRLDSSYNAPDCPPSHHLRAVMVRVVHQHLRRTRHHLLHRSRHPPLASGLLSPGHRFIAGAHFGTPPRLPNHAIPTLLGDFAIL